MVSLVGFSTHFTSKVVTVGFYMGFTDFQTYGGNDGGFFEFSSRGLLKKSSELEVDSLRWILDFLKMVCLVGFSTHFTSKVVTMRF